MLQFLKNRFESVCACFFFMLKLYMSDIIIRRLDSDLRHTLSFTVLNKTNEKKTHWQALSLGIFNPPRSKVFVQFPYFWKYNVVVSKSSSSSRISCLVNIQPCEPKTFWFRVRFYLPITVSHHKLCTPLRPIRIRNLHTYDQHRYHNLLSRHLV